MFTKGIGEYISEIKKGGGESREITDGKKSSGVFMQTMDYPDGYLVLIQNKSKLVFDGTYDFNMQNLKIEEVKGTVVNVKLDPGKEELIIMSTINKTD